MRGALGLAEILFRLRVGTFRSVWSFEVRTQPLIVLVRPVPQFEKRRHLR